MRCAGIATLMVFVDRPGEAAYFWGQLLGATPDDEEPQLVDADQVRLFFHAADPQRNPQGGTVPYLAVADFNAARADLLKSGACRIAGR